MCPPPRAKYGHTYVKTENAQRWHNLVYRVSHRAVYSRGLLLVNALMVRLISSVEEEINAPVDDLFSIFLDISKARASIQK